jgi:hypothetical protein
MTSVVHERGGIALSDGYKISDNKPALPPMIAPVSVCPLMLPIPAPTAAPPTVLHAARASMPHATIRVVSLRVIVLRALQSLGYFLAEPGATMSIQITPITGIVRRLGLASYQRVIRSVI